MAQLITSGKRTDMQNLATAELLGLLSISLKYNLSVFSQ